MGRDMIASILDLFFGDTKHKPARNEIQYEKLDSVPISAVGRYIRFVNAGSQKAYARMSMTKDVQRADQSLNVDLLKGAVGICTRVNGQCMIVAFEANSQPNVLPNKNPIRCHYCVDIFPLHDGRWEIEII